MRLLLLVSVLAVAVPDRQDPTVKNTDARPLHERLLGEWRLVKRVTNGSVDANPADFRMLFTPGAMQHLHNNGTRPGAKFTYTLDIAKTPNAIIFGGSETGIIKVDGDVLTICLGSPGTYPTEFVSAPNSSFSLVELTRIKK